MPLTKPDILLGVHVSARRRTAQAVQRRVQRCEPYLRAALKDVVLPQATEQKLLLVMARCYQAGYQMGRRAGWHGRRRQQEAA